MSNSVTPLTAACQASLSITNSRGLLKFMSSESVMLSNHLILCHPLLPPSIFHSIRVFSIELVLCIRWPKYWNFRFSISPSNEYSGLIYFRMDWLDLLLAVQRTLKSLLQHHSSKASILRCSAFFIVQLSHPYMTTGKTIAFFFCNKEFMIWAIVSSQPCFCWLYRASPPLVAKNIINLTSVLTIWWCSCVESSLVLLEEGVCYDQCILLAKLY